MNAQKDSEHFEERLSRGKSQLIPGHKLPSLLRSLCFTGEFTNENQFVHWDDFFNLFMTQVANEIFSALEAQFKAPWSNELKGLVLMWNAKFPEDPFIPKSFQPDNTLQEDTELEVDVKPTRHPILPLLRQRNPQGDESDDLDIYRYGEFPFD